MMKKAQVPIMAVVYTIFALIVIYLVLMIPFVPLFQQIRATMDYFIFIIFWVTLQVGLIIAYYKVGQFAFKGFVFMKTKIIGWSMNFRRYIIMHK